MGDAATLIGLIIALVSVGVAMVLKGANPSVLMNPAAFLIIIAGTFGALFVAFPMKEVKKLPGLLKIAIMGRTFPDKADLILQLIEYTNLARRDGMLALDSISEKVEDPFMKKGLALAINTSSSESLSRILEADIDAMKERHRSGATFFTQAGTYAPSLGVLGAVVGLIAALGNLNDIEKLGHSIAAAFVATLLGIFTGYIFWHPLANKMKQFSRMEVEIKELIMVGILCIQRGERSFFAEQELLSYLSQEEIKQYELKKGAKHVEEKRTA